MLVRDLVFSNTNKNVKWKIDGKLFPETSDIPDWLLMIKMVTWEVNQWEGIISIVTNGD